MASEESKDRSATGFSVLSEEEAKQNYKDYLDLRSAREPWYSDRVENDNFYHNVQFQPGEEDDIIARGQAPLVINVTYSIIKQIISFITSNAPTWEVDPVGDVDKQYCYLQRKLLEATWYSSRGNRQLTSIVKDFCIAGVGYGYINPDYTSTFGLSFKHIPYHQVYISPNAREFDYSDADMQIISKIVSVKQAAMLINKSEDFVKERIESLSQANLGDDEQPTTRYVRYTTPLNQANTARIIQKLTLEHKDVYVVEPINGAAITRKVYFERNKDLEKIEKSGIGRIRVIKNKKVLVKYLSVGDYCERYYLPIETYNLVPFINEFNGNPFPLGDVDFLYGLQRAMNKFIMLTILNATLSNNMKMIAPEGSIDRDAYEKSYSIPGSLTEYKWTNGQPEPKQINPAPFGNEFFGMSDKLVSMMEYITGIYGVLQGNPSGAPDTLGGTISLQNYGSQKVKLSTRNINDALSTVGDVAISLFQNYAPFNQIVSYFDGKELVKMPINYLRVDNSSGEPRIVIENDLSIGKFRTRVNIQTNYGSERQAKAQVLANLASQTKSPQLIPTILRMADIPEADEIAEQFDSLNKANMTISQMQEQIKRLNQINKQLENEAMRKSQSSEIAKFKADLRVLYEKIKSELSQKSSAALSGLENDIANVLQDIEKQGVNGNQSS